MPRSAWAWTFAVLSLLLALWGLVVGSVPIPVGQVWRVLIGAAAEPDMAVIVREVRLPEILTAVMAGAGLSACGLVMQTVFQNPLAGPSVLGISSGASLGVALVMLVRPLWQAAHLPLEVLVVLAAVGGSAAVLLLITLADRRIGNAAVLLIIGLMLSYLCSALISVLQAMSLAPALKGYVLWGLGSFAGVPLQRLPWLVVPGLVGLASALSLVKPLNALLLGSAYAGSMGTDAKAVRRRAIWVAGLLAGSITAFCGPIAFLGLATPHVARAFVRTSDHRVLMPATILLGTSLALGCDLLVRAAGPGTPLPLNAVTSLLGAPVVLWVILGGRHWSPRTDR